MIHSKSWKLAGKFRIGVRGTREALRSRPRRRPRPRILGSGVMECWSNGVLRFVRIAPRYRWVGSAAAQRLQILAQGFNPGYVV